MSQPVEAIRTLLKELIVPELDKIKEENREIKAILNLTNKRLDDVNTHLVDQSRRIDALREELTQRIEALREELTHRIDALRAELTHRIDKIDGRLDRLYEVVVRREEHQKLEERLTYLEHAVGEIKHQLAAGP